MFIDADAHVIECPDTWSYFPSSMADLRPAELSFDEGEVPGFMRLGHQTKAVLIDGGIFRHAVNNDDETGTTADRRELRDIAGRLKDMDEAGVETQVLYPTSQLSELTERPELEIAICESYNRWMADRCDDSGGRLKWLAVLPLRSMSDALKELQRARDAGAIGIFRRGVESGNRRASDPYFDPIYSAAQDLDIPICFHIARPYSGHHQAMAKTHQSIFVTGFTIDAFLAVVMGGAYRKFPRLRFGFIEAAAGWLPYALWLARFESMSSNKSSGMDSGRALMDEGRIFVTCEVSEDIPYLLGIAGNNGFCIGTDYSHGDRATYGRAHQEFTELTAVDELTARKVTDTNARKFYALP